MVFKIINFIFWSIVDLQCCEVRVVLNHSVCGDLLQ